MKNPLLFLTPVFCSGIFIFKEINLPFSLIYFPAVILFIAIYIFSGKHLVPDILLCVSVFLSGGILLSNSRIIPANDISRYFNRGQNEDFAVKGLVDSFPEYKGGNVVLTLKTKEVYLGGLAYKCRGRLLVYIEGNEELRYGQELTLWGRPYFIHNYKSNFKEYLSGRGVYSLMKVRILKESRSFKFNPEACLKSFIFRMKDKLNSLISKNLSSVSASVLKAMILGDKKSLPPLINTSMIYSGTVHILVVSGFNVGIVAFVIALVLKVMRLKRSARFAVICPLILFYSALTGLSSPVVRASVMVIVFMYAYFVRREVNIYNSLCVSALFILGFNPNELFNLGFQLSFASVFSMAYLYPKIRLFFCVDRMNSRFLRYILDNLFVSFSAWVGTFGLIACNFRIISFVAVFANIAIVPLAAFITLSGVVLVFMTVFLPGIAHLFAVPCEAAVTILIRLNDFFVSLPWAYYRI